MYTSIKVSAAKSKNLRDPRGLTDLSKYANDPKIVNFARIDFIFFLKPLVFSRRIGIFGVHIDQSKCSENKNLRFFEVSYSMSTNSMIPVLSDFSETRFFLQLSIFLSHRLQ